MFRTTRWCALILAAGCVGDGDGGFVQTKRGDIALEYKRTGSALVFSKGEVAVGQTTTATLLVRNQGDAELHVSRIALAYEAPADALESDGPALRLASIGGQPAAGEAGPFAIAEGGSLAVVVAFHRYGDTLERTATLTIASDTRDATERELTVPLGTAEGNAVANVAPSHLDFKIVHLGNTAEKPVQVTNTGSEVLTVSGVLFKGHAGFRLHDGEGELEPGDIAFDPPLRLDPQQSMTFRVTFTPTNDAPAEGQLVFYTNDAAHPDGLLVTMQANRDRPCITAVPAKVQFGGKLVGTKSLLPVDLVSCGETPVVVTDIALVAGSSAAFTLDALPALPFTVPVNGQVSLDVLYVPALVAPPGDDGHPIFDTATLRVTSTALQPELDVPVSGVGVDSICPTAIALVAEGESVVPQTNLHLIGDQSYAADSAIDAWLWTVEQPPGSASVFVPGAGFANPTLEANVAGVYRFRLDVWDEAGRKSCVPAEIEVAVIPKEAIHVELLWHTPNDPNESDQGPEAGADLDLHFVYDAYAATQPDLDGDGAPDPWFDQPFDCFWFNAHPNWGSFDPGVNDNPSLDRDDTDGAGPENLNLDEPQDTRYRIGVHYWSSHGYGPSLATLRVYIYGVLVMELNDVKLQNHDMWEAATIDWPSGQVTVVETPAGAYKITPGYQNPYFFQP